MRFAALLAVMATAKAVALSGHHPPRSAWAPIAFLWHDAAVALVSAALEAAVLSRTGREPRTRGSARIVFAWILYGMLVAYVVVNVPVTRVLATPMTRPMWHAARGPLTDSILRYATIDTLLACALVAAVGVVGPVVFHRVRRIYPHALMAASILAVALGPMAAAQVETNGLERNAWTALITTALPPPAAGASPATWSRTGFERTNDEDLTSLRGAAAGRNVVLVSLESAGAQYLGLYGAHPDVMPNLSRLARQA